MCIYSGILGSGPVLVIQLATLISIFASIAFWVWIYQKQKIDLRPYAVPILLWIIFGSLDALMTAKGTFGNPYYEANPLSRFIFIHIGYAGPVVASILWISLWGGIVLVINKVIASKFVANFASLTIFYSLSVGHLLGFSSWFLPFCGLTRFALIIPEILRIIAMGIILSFAHIAIAKGMEHE